MGGVVSALLHGPEQVFRLTLTQPAANFGVVIVRRAAGVRVEPRVVAAGDENRLTGLRGAPGQPQSVPGRSSTTPSSRPERCGRSREATTSSSTAPSPAGAGSFAFSFWINDTLPPSLTIAQPRVRRGLPLVVRVADGGSGVDPATVKTSIDGTARVVPLRAGTLRIPTTGLRRGTHRLRVQASDYQESRNMENVPPILPNTRVLTRTIVIR